MTSATTGNLIIDSAQPSEHADAFLLVFSDIDSPYREHQADSLTESAKLEQDWAAGLFVARRGERLVGATWVQLAAGNSAVVWSPRRIEGESNAVVDELLNAADAFLSRRRGTFAQAVLTDVDGSDAKTLVRMGFHQVAELLYLVCLAEHFPHERQSCELTFQTFSERDRDRLASLLERTYEGTRDCPALNGVRNIHDVLAGYRATGEFSPARWLFVRHERRDVGCLLLADHAADEQWEIVYLGLAPEARGRGWGLAMVRYAQWLTRCAGRHRLVLAVDAANAPAVAMYSAANFALLDKRTVLLKVYG